MRKAEVIYLPLPKLENVRDVHWLQQELERAEGRVADIKRILGIRAVQQGPSEGGDETA